MTEARQVFDFDRGEYERPNQSWLCGRACEGVVCALGPTASGKCGAVCEPYRDGDRYYCNNVSALSNRCDSGPLSDGSCCRNPAECAPAKKAGEWVCARGQCMVGPLPGGQCSQQQNVCRPQRSVWSKRRVVTISTVALVLGGLLVLMAGPNREKFVSPGALTSAHAASSCKACHLAGEETLSDWVHRAFSAGDAPEQSEQKCLACHSDLGAEPLNAHGLQASSLASITAQVAGRGGAKSRMLIDTARKIFGRPYQGEEKIACSVCHQEHRGRGHDLTSISNDQCQSCHQNTFHSLENGHPSFSDYPYERRTRIYFDHTTHYNQHFDSFERIMPDGRKPASCLTCHNLDESGKKMLVRGFDEACSSCHSSQIQDTLVTGVALLAVPRMDSVALADERLPIGVWPKHPLSQDGFGPQGQLPPLMALLLLADERYSQRRASLTDLDLLSLADATPGQVESIVILTAAIKQLLYEVARGDRERLSQRLDATIGRLVPATTIQQFVDLLMEASQSAEMAEATWFPELSDEFDGGEAVVQDSYKPQAVVAPDSDGRVGWRIDSADLTVRYGAIGHADLTAKRWLETVVAIRNAVVELTDDDELGVKGAVGRLFEEVTSPIATGRCIKCHSIDQVDNRVVINWFARRAEPDNRTFTHFAHSPHVKEMLQGACNTCHTTEGEECMQCHTIKSDLSRYRPHFFDRDWAPVLGSAHFSSDFNDLPTSNCAECHNSSASRSDCLTCHQYHVRQVGIPPAASIGRVAPSVSHPINVHESP